MENISDKELIEIVKSFDFVNQEGGKDDKALREFIEFQGHAFNVQTITIFGCVAMREALKRGIKI